MNIRIARDVDGVDWTAVRTDLLADDFENGRIPAALERSTLMTQVPGQHIALQTDDAQAFDESLGFRPQPELYSVVVGTWLDNPANRDGSRAAT